MIKDLWQDNKKPTISFEFFPGRDEKAIKKLDKVVDNLAELKPDFVSVTFGAGGSTRDGSFQLAEKLQKKNLKVLTYVAAFGLAPTELAKVLDDYQRLGIEDILCVRGDEPEEVNFQVHPDRFAHASDFLLFVNKKFDFHKGAAGYPEGHKDAESKDKDLEFLKLKIKNGAEFIITQYCYDTDYFIEFRDRCRAKGINVPIIAGVMPIYSIKMTENLAAMCGATITPYLRGELEKLPPDDKEALANFAVDFAVNQCKELIENGVQGIHFYTMDRGKTVIKIINRLKELKLL